MQLAVTSSAARVVDVAPDSLMIEITGDDEKIDGLLEVLQPFGVIEVAKTGCLAMARGSVGRARRTKAGPAVEHVDAAVVSFSVSVGRPRSDGSRRARLPAAPSHRRAISNSLFPLPLTRTP